MIGFIYSEELKDFDQADQAFRELLRRYPKAELASSAQWMIDHMRSEDAPTFINLDADSAATGEPAKASAPKKSEPLESEVGRIHRKGQVRDRQAVNIAEVKVNGLIVEHKTQQNIVILRELDGERILPIWIGPGEAQAIRRILSEESFPRPLTHDLLFLIVEGLKAKITRVVIADLRENTFFASVIIEREDEVLSIDALARRTRSRSRFAPRPRSSSTRSCSSRRRSRTKRNPPRRRTS